MAPALHELVVLLGPDYVGKSSVMRVLRRHSRWSLVSCDDDFVPESYGILKDLRRLFLEQALARASDMHSPDFLVTGLQMSTVYLRDRACFELGKGPVLVDAYYYKVLAKCALTGLVSERLFDAWRRYPQPDRVIFLRVDPEVAFARARLAGTLNGFEHHGQAGSFREFARFQRDLVERMLHEVRSLPLQIVDANRPLRDVETDVAALLSARPHAPTERADAPALTGS